MPSQLFSPLQLGPIELPNRIVVSPMCQYSAEDGSATDWHIQHVASLGMSGAGLVILEATGVEARGRISHGCLGLYSDANEAALAGVMTTARRYAGPTRFGIQLAHAGRKASTHIPWAPRTGPLGPSEKPWTTVAPSALPFDEGWHTPEALDEAGMRRVIDAFAAAAKRAARIGFDLVELHGAHGYLVHEFLSPLVNKRTDSYGGSIENRMRFPLAIARALREALPAGVALGARITGSDWTEGGWTPDDAAIFAGELRKLGAVYACVSSGGAVPKANIPLGPGYQVPLAANVKQKAGILTQAVGLISDFDQAEEIVVSGKADMVALARGFLDDPRWGWHAADHLGGEAFCPPQHRRSRPPLWKPVRHA
jgi:2,4-dienoyl-CoA reductase-like NADH-dependent reductase (Old Yellow Enzyme family)